MDGKSRIAYFKAMLAGRDTLVEDGQYHASVKLVDGKSPVAQERARKQVLAASARSKLTKEELAALKEELK
jgi:hypothetical protein